MEKTVESQRFTPAETNQVNLCRLYLGATTVSDISNANGTHLASGIRKGHRSSQQSTPKGPMVKQDRPDQASWTLWRRLLSLFCSTDDKLYRSLTSWTSTGDFLRRHWPFLYSPTLHLLFRRYQNSFESCTKTRPHIFNYIPLEIVNHLPDNVQSPSMQLTSLLDGEHLPSL
jgi:hypothetical protein